MKRALFRAAVPEQDGIQRLTAERHWFHSSFFNEPLAQPSLVIASRADRIVPASQSERFAAAIGARAHLLGPDQGVAHDDLFASPQIIPVISDLMIKFVGGL